MTARPFLKELLKKLIHANEEIHGGAADSPPESAPLSAL